MNRGKMEEQYVSDRISSENRTTLCRSLDISTDTDREEVEILLGYEAKELNYNDLFSYTQ